MWEWQHVFQKKVSSLLGNVLKILEIQAITNTFIVGVPISRQDVEHIYFQPEDCGFTSRQFKEVFSIVIENLESDLSQDLLITSARLQEEYHNSLYPKALKKTVESILNKHDKAKELISLCSFPIKINNHWVITVIQIERKVFNDQYKLRRETYQFDLTREVKVSCSFFESIIITILAYSNNELQTPSKGYDYSVEPKRVLEDAALNLLSSVEQRVTSGYSCGNLFEFGNFISAERYEGSSSKGRLIICRKDNSNISIKIKLEVPVRMNNYRGVRKLLEISSETIALLCDCTNVWGLGEPSDTYKSCSEDLFEIRFTEHYTWELIHNQHVMLRVKYREATLPRKRFDQNQFCDHITRLFGINEETKLATLVEAVEAAVKQSHGTILVITPDAEKEGKRLASQSTVIAPIPVSGDIISHVSSIDGAVLISPDGIMYAFGVILDGLASNNGNPARGARFNSAIRYVDGKNNSNTKCLALIVSEDGYVNLYPTLKPRVPRVLIDELLEQLDKYADPSQLFDGEKASATLRKLEQQSFYLLSEDINRVNEAKNAVIARMEQYRIVQMAETGSGFIIPELKNFAVDKEMNDEYYL